MWQGGGRDTRSCDREEGGDTKSCDREEGGTLDHVTGRREGH